MEHKSRYYGTLKLNNIKPYFEFACKGTLFQTITQYLPHFSIKKSSAPLSAPLFPLLSTGVTTSKYSTILQFYDNYNQQKQLCLGTRALRGPRKACFVGSLTRPRFANNDVRRRRASRRYTNYTYHINHIYNPRRREAHNACEALCAFARDDVQWTS